MRLNSMRLRGLSGALALLVAGTAGCGGEETLRCGDGTKQQGDQCVASAATGDLTRPQLDAVKLSRLVVAEEGLRPIYALHPVHVDLALAVRGEAFESMVVVGLDSADGSKSCVLGTLTTSFAGSETDAAEGDTPADSLIAVSGELYAQPECAAMAGEKAAVAWVSFDPFLRTTVTGMPSPVLDNTATDAPDAKTLIAARRLSLEGCKAGDGSAHPDACQTALEVAASPGVDLEMAEANLDSSVAIYHHIVQPDLAKPAKSDLEPGTELVLPKLSDFVAPVPTTPHFAVATRLRMLGVAGPDDDPLADKDLKLTFALRPDASALPADSTITTAWAPLYAEVAKVDKAGDPTFEKLEAEFLESIVGSTEHIKDSPIFIAKESAERLDGPWRALQQFELQVCADPGIDEGGVDADPKANNCRIFPVVIVHRETPMVPLDSIGGATGAGDPGAATEKDVYKGFDEYSGTSGQLRLHTTGGTQTFLTVPTSYSYRKSGSSLTVTGWFTWTLYDFYKKTQVKLSPMAGQVRERFVLNNVTLRDETNALDLGVTVKKDYSKARDFSVNRVYGIPHFVDVTLSIGVSISATLEAEIFGGIELPIIDCKTKGTTVGEQCFYVPRSETDSSLPMKLTRSKAEKWCKDHLGMLAEPVGADQNNAVVALLDAAKAGSGWVGTYQRRHVTGNSSTIYDDDKCKTDYLTPIIGFFQNNPAYLNDAIFADCASNERRWRWPSGKSWQNSHGRWADNYPVHVQEFGYDERGVYVKVSDKKWRNVEAGTSRPFACEFLTPERIKLSATVKPIAAVSLFGELSAEAIGLKGIVRATVDLIALQFPVTGTLIFQVLAAETRVTPSLTGDIELTTLGGSIKWEVKVWDLFKDKWVTEWSGTLYSWSGFTAASWRIFTLDDLWRLY